MALSLLNLLNLLNLLDLLDLLGLLARLTLAGSGAITLVLLLRRPLRRFAGADAAYLGWLIVPLALGAAALPALTVAPTSVLAIAPSLNASALTAGATPAAAAIAAATEWVDWALRAWAGGVLATAVLLLLGQRAFVRSLGRLEERDGILFAAHASHGPALLGLVNPAIVVPADFATRYTACEQALILAHEREHAARGDPAANAALAALQCAFWFNPLMHIAASRFRFDQELACDAAVMARHGAQRQAYAAAMLKTQAAGAIALATCHWQSSHPLKERIMQLKQTSVTTPRRRAGRLIVALVAGACVLGMVAARAGTSAGPGEVYEIAVTVADGTTSTVRARAGEDFALRQDKPGQNWTGVFSLTPAPDDSVFVKTRLTQENGKVIAPSLLLRLGQTGTVREGSMANPSFQLGLTVTRAAPTSPRG